MQVGLGYRRSIAHDILDSGAAFDSLEIIAESFFDLSWQKASELRELRRRFTLIPHGLRLSIGSVVRPPQTYLDDIARVLEWTGAPYHSDHFAFTGCDGIELHHLSPLWHTEAGLETVIANVDAVQRFLGVQLVLETITHSFRVPDETLTPAQFISTVVAETGCGVLLDVTNTYINAVNFGEDPLAFVTALPATAIRQLHIVGYARDEHGTLLDGHAHAIQPELWELYDRVLAIAAPDQVIIERDAQFPPIEELGAEAARARVQEARRCGSA